MAVRHKIRQDKKKRTFVTIPAFLRDHFGIENGDEVSIDIENEQIVIVHLKK